MITVAVAAGGARWEAEVIAEIERSAVLALARRCVDAADLLALTGTGRAQVALVDPQLGGLDLDAVARLRDAGIAVVGIGAAAPELGIVAAVAPGALDDIAREELLPQPPPAADATGHIIAVWGPTGAPGRTSVAVELAASLARAHDTVLVDLDTRGGAVAQALGILDDVSGLVAACRSANSGHRERIADALTQVDARFHVLTGIPRPEMWTQVRAAALHAVLDRLAADHEVIVLDTGFSKEAAHGVGPARDQATLAGLERAHETVVVGRAEPLGLARLLRCLDDASPWRRPPSVVVNHFRPSLGWSDQEVGAMLREVGGHEPLAFLPSDPQAHDAAAVHGVPVRVASPTSPWVARVDQLAQQVLRTAPSRW